MSLIKALALFKGADRGDSLDSTIKWCNSFLDRHLWRYYKKTIHLRVPNAPLVSTAFKFSCVHIKKARSDGGWNKEGWRKEIRGRLEECSRAPTGGVMWRTKQREGNWLVTFNDVFSVEASLCLRSATGGKEVHVRGVSAYSSLLHSSRELKQLQNKLCSLFAVSVLITSDFSHGFSLSTEANAWFFCAYLGLV